MQNSVQKRTRLLLILIGFSILGLFLFLRAFQKPWDLLSESEKATLAQIQTHWETWIPAKKADGTAPLITFDELYHGLDQDQQNFLDRVRAIDPRKSFGFQGGRLGESAEGISFKRIENQKVVKAGQEQTLDPQYLPENVFSDYSRMMEAMRRDLGKRLWVDSGYRSPAYQLYTYLFYLPKHHYSLAETGYWVALPGYSEHGAPQTQAIDFINQEGINGEERVEDFEHLPEYGWLLKHAGEFGFELSYPRGQKGITFEPWHWRWKDALNDNSKQ
ncbi:MAG: M15 family metallopeptidase [Candidatus Omnitrophica bacterium]|nr:M15 family metallopeptidase [Candidatus Omnitrophota bacterium]